MSKNIQLKLENNAIYITFLTEMETLYTKISIEDASHLAAELHGLLSMLPKDFEINKPQTPILVVDLPEAEESVRLKYAEDYKAVHVKEQEESMSDVLRRRQETIYQQDETILNLRQELESQQEKIGELNTEVMHLVRDKSTLEVNIRAYQSSIRVIEKLLK